jgi:hypothetical protein
MDESVRPIRFLREYSNYLTPRAGFFSADTWTMIGIYVRNALLNQVTIVGLLVALLLVPRGLHAACSWYDGHRGWALLIAALFWLSGIVVLSLNLRRLDPPEAKSLVEDETPVASGTARAPGCTRGRLAFNCSSPCRGFSPRPSLYAGCTVKRSCLPLRS